MSTFHDRSRRALLFTPGDSRKKIEKGIGLNVDSLILDLEDGVALNQKETAREEVARALQELSFGRSEKIVRINPVGESLYQADLDATLPAHPDAVLIPKVENASQVQEVDAYISAVEAQHGWPLGEISVLVLIESALSVVNLKEIASSSSRLSALVFGAEDLAADMGAVRSDEGLELLWARSSTVMHAKAYGLQAIDTPYLRLDAEADIEPEARRALNLGYTGKLAIHPKQVEPLHVIFTPTTQEVISALRLSEANAVHQASGAGVFVYEGKMIDMPTIRIAERILNRARAAGIDLSSFSTE